MDTLKAFLINERSQGKTPRVFDWDKAAKLIAERKPTEASAGLQSDWEWTVGAIFRDGKPVPQDETYTYLASNLAAPELDLDGDVIECWVYKDGNCEWDADTYWPESALTLLETT